MNQTLQQKPKLKIVKELHDTNGKLLISVSKELSQDSLTSDVLSLGVDTDLTKTLNISARDHATASQRPVLIIEHSYESYDLTYDANGNLIEGFGKKLAYDGWNILNHVNDSTTDTVIESYVYDHEGVRRKKVSYNIDNNGNNLSSYYIGGRPALFVHNRITNGTIYNETYIYLYDKLISKVDNDKRKFFYHPDHLGSTTLITNESGDVVQYISYLPFGEVLSGDLDDERFGFTGQENDASGFIDYGNRQYDSKFRRFVQCDSVIPDIYNPQDLNCYAYVRNNPYKYVDPDGKTGVLVVGAAIVVTVGFVYATEIISGVSSGESFRTSYDRGAQRAGAKISNIQESAAEIASSLAPSELLRRASLAKDIIELVRDVSDQENLPTTPDYTNYPVYDNQRDDGTNYKYTDEYGNERDFRDYEEYLMYQQNQQLINQQSNEEGGGFNDVSGNVPGPSGSGGGSSSSSSSISSSGGSTGSGSGSGGSSGGSPWYCFGGLFC
jgi:RHS repeat-associated protein